MTTDPQQPESTEPIAGDAKGSPSPSGTGGVSRRGVLWATAIGGVAAGVGAGIVWSKRGVSMSNDAVVIRKADAYDDRLAGIIRGGLAELGIGRDWVRGKSVVLKPNLVEPYADRPHINTHPLFIRAVAEVFRGWDAKEVVVAEGQGHLRDTYLVLEQSGVGKMLDEAGLEFVDLNHDDVDMVENAVRQSYLTHFMLPRTIVRRADIVVSLPKMKTHHWAGVTLSMKNLFGVMPGIVYGWPKNVLHQIGLDKAIVDITGTVRPHLAIVDGVIGMEGDGPIMGDARNSGLVVMGASPLCVDATAARLMGFDPANIPYLNRANGLLGTTSAAVITQRGETIDANEQTFRLLDHPAMKKFRPTP
ncbi:MAG: DUF362 domain-containing protein [Phycisphaera sp.]|nr:DUF362 domain-containing protein [Phycisphaera sp.]